MVNDKRESSGLGPLTPYFSSAGASPTSSQPPALNPGVAGAYRVRLDLFEGPLDLLLHLIKKNEVDITNIPIAMITEQYLAYVELMRELNLDVAGEFLVMAATLMLVKSRLLLPSPEPEDEEEPDPRADLVRRLLEYQRYREAAESLRERPLLHRDVFAREPNAEGMSAEGETPQLARVTSWELVEAFRAVLRRARPDPVHEVESDPVSLQDRVQGLLGSLSVAHSITFDSLFSETATRQYVIVTFLALLELMRLGAVEAVQEASMDTIMIVLAVDDVSSVKLDFLDEYEGTAPAAVEQADE